MINPKEGSQEYYLENRDKIDHDDIETYKYFPIGEPMRKSYDYKYLVLNEFLERYYKLFDKQEHWDGWFSRIILVAYNKEYEKFRKLMDGVADWFDYAGMHTFYEKLKLKNDFDDDILLFISYLYGEGFFKNINLSYEDWILSKDFDRRDLTRYIKEWIAKSESNKSYQVDKYSLKEIASFPYGMNLIREKIIGLEYWKR